MSTAPIQAVPLFRRVENLSEKGTLEAITPALIELEADKASLRTATQKIQKLFGPLLANRVYTNNAIQTLAAEGLLNDAEFALAKLRQIATRHPSTIQTKAAALPLAEFLEELSKLASTTPPIVSDSLTERVWRPASECFPEVPSQFTQSGA